jgi:hypothetical protein
MTRGVRIETEVATRHSPRGELTASSTLLILVEKDVRGTPPDTKIGDSGFLSNPEKVRCLINREKTVRQQIVKIGSMGESISPKVLWSMSMSEKAASHVGQDPIATLSNTILLG